MIRSNQTYSESENVFLSYLGNSWEQSKSSVSWYDFGARNYDPSLGMWFNVDPMLERYHTSSPYHFAGNDPVNNIELNGAAFAYRHINPLTGMFDDGSGGGGSGGGYRRVGHVYYNSEGHSVPFWEVFFNYIKPNSVILTRSEKQNLVSRNRGGSGSSGGYIVNIEGVAKWVAKNLGIRISKTINWSYSTSSFSLNNISMYGMSMSASLFGGGLPQDPNLMPDPSVNDGMIWDGKIDFSQASDNEIINLIFSAIKKANCNGSKTFRIEDIFYNITWKSDGSTHGFSVVGTADINGVLIDVKINASTFARNARIVSHAAGTTPQQYIGNENWTYVYKFNTVPYKSPNDHTSALFIFIRDKVTMEQYFTNNTNVDIINDYLCF